MVTLTNFALIGMVEVFVVLIGGVLSLAFYNRSLYKRSLHQRSQLQRLKKTLSDGDPAMEYLDREIEASKLQYQQLVPHQKIRLVKDQSPPEQIVALRHLFLESEKLAVTSPDVTQKWHSLGTSLGKIVTGLSELLQEPEKKNELDLGESWTDLCATALKLLESRSRETEDNLIALLQVINSELGFGQLLIPERQPKSEEQRQTHNSTVDTVNKLKQSAGDNKQLIEKLLAQKDAAETEVTIKADELKKLQRFLNESEVCIKLLEDELEGLRKELREHTELSGDASDMKELIQKFAKESSEMLTCIETLEKENNELRAQLDLPDS